MSAFASAWHLLKAIPEQQGYMGTLPPAVRGMMERARAQGSRGPVQHTDRRGMERNPETGEMARTGPFRSEPVDVVAGEGEELPASNRRIERDLSPLQEAYQTMVGHSQSMSPATEGPMQGQMVPKTSMATVPGHELMPEEAFYTPREARLAREGMEQSAGRQLTSGQRGGRMDMTGGSKSGMYTPLRGQTDEGKRIRVANRRAANLGNVEGMRQGARLGGASDEFVDRTEEREEQRAPTQEERIAQLLQGMGDQDGNVSFDPNIAPARGGEEAEEEEKAPLPRNERLRPMGRRQAERLEQSKNSMGKPNLDIPQQPGMAEMFADPSGPEGQATMQNFEQVDSANRQRLMAMAKQKALEQANINQQG
tara:strand:+ start:609 stop:1709 length:1101 start_codon:yes stop_codon:yes gene_type:complete